MPADIVSDQLLPARQMEQITLMNDYGNLQVISINMQTQASSRAEIIADAQAAMVTMQTNMAAYYAAAGTTLPAVLTLAQKQALYIQQNTPPSGVNTMTVTASVAAIPVPVPSTTTTTSSVAS